MDTASRHTVPGYDVTSQCNILAFFDYFTMKTKGISHCHNYLELLTQWQSTSFQRPQSSAICYENLPPRINFLLYPPQHFYSLLGFVPLNTRKKILKYSLQTSILSAEIRFYIQFFFNKHLHSRCEISIKCNILQILCSVALLYYIIFIYNIINIYLYIILYFYLQEMCTEQMRTAIS